MKYSYCLGGKDGVPYPVDRESYDESIEILNNAIKDAKLGNQERMRALRRLRRCIPRELSESRPHWWIENSQTLLLPWTHPQVPS